MRSLDKIRNEVVEVWVGDQPNARPEFVALWDGMVEGLQLEEANRVTLDRVLEFAPEGLDLNHAMKFALFLSGEGMKVLELKYELLRDDGSKCSLDIGEVCRALEADFLFDPWTKKRVDNWKSHVLMFFTVTEEVKDLLWPPDLKLLGEALKALEDDNFLVEGGMLEACWRYPFLKKRHQVKELARVLRKIRKPKPHIDEKLDALFLDLKAGHMFEWSRTVLGILAALKETPHQDYFEELVKVFSGGNGAEVSELRRFAHGFKFQENRENT